MQFLKLSNGSEETETYVDFLAVADDLLMITIDNNLGESPSTPSYWRLIGTNGNPPLEIGIDVRRKIIQSITFFIDSECFRKVNVDNILSIKSNGFVDTNIFHKQNDYIDQEGRYFVSLADNKLACFFEGTYHVSTSLLNGCLEFFMTDEGELCGFLVGSLSEVQLSQIYSLFNEKSQ